MDLSGERLYLDMNLFIYALERVPQFAQASCRTTAPSGPRRSWG